MLTELLGRKTISDIKINYLLILINICLLLLANQEKEVSLFCLAETKISRDRFQ
jgi:hypothetical protein